jgi:2-phosphosulfolactate phosphatase
VNHQIEVCFSPAVFQDFFRPELNVVVVDVLRATSSICTAFINGAEKLIPIGSVDELKGFVNMGHVLAGERNGYTLDFVDFGNSPFNFTRDKVENKTVIYSTTNGTRAIQMASRCRNVIVGSFLNISSVCNWLDSQNEDVLVLCAGWKNRFSLEDTLLAGAICEKLVETGHFSTICDSAISAIDLWQLAKSDLMKTVEKCAQRHRLKQKGLDDVLEYCFTPDITDIIPVYGNGVLKPMVFDIK